MLVLSGRWPPWFYAIFSENWWFQTKRFTGLLELIQLYKQNPLDKFLILTIYQNYTLDLIIFQYVFFSLECLDMLIVSLRQAQFSVDHIPSLFYLAETTLYWLRTDAMDQPFLRIGEIKLLKVNFYYFTLI